MVLSLHDITIGYPRATIARHLSAHLDRGTMTCLIGRNGSGKSTLLRTVAMLQPPLSGSITVSVPTPTDITALTPRQRAKTIGLVLTSRTAPDNMLVREMVAMGRSPYTGFWGTLSSCDNDIVAQAMSMTGVTAFANTPVGNLSDGERQKVMIAKALAQQTPIIMLDEPTAFLDYPSKISVMQTLHSLCHDSGVTVLLSTHDLDAALRITDNVWLLADGKLLTGTPTSLQKEIEEFMGGR